MAFGREGYGFEFSHCQSAFPLGIPLLAVTPFLENDCYSIGKWSKRQKTLVLCRSKTHCHGYQFSSFTLLTHEVSEWSKGLAQLSGDFPPEFTTRIDVRWVFSLSSSLFNFVTESIMVIALSPLEKRGIDICSGEYSSNLKYYERRWAAEQ